MQQTHSDALFGKLLFATVCHAMSIHSCLRIYCDSSPYIQMGLKNSQGKAPTFRINETDTSLQQI